MAKMSLEEMNKKIAEQEAELKAALRGDVIDESDLKDLKKALGELKTLDKATEDEPE